MRFPLNALQLAVYERLSADMAPLGVYDDGAVPEGTAFPYVTIGVPSFAPSPLKGHHLTAATLTFHAFSVGIGKKEVNEMMNRIVASLSRAPLALTDNFEETTMGFWEFADNSPEEHEVEGIVQHGVVRYRWEILDTVIS